MKKVMNIQDINQQNALGKTQVNTHRKTHFKLSANSYMFRHQGAILSGFDNNNKNKRILRRLVKAHTK